MKFYKTADRNKIILCWCAVCTALATLLFFPSECRNGGTNGVFLCLQVLIPSLFPFMVLSGFCVHSRLVHRTPRVLGVFTKALFGLPSPAAMIILLSLIGGYPTGAKGIASLYERKLISKSQANAMAMFCVAAGPGFLVTYLGNVMLGCVKLGYILLASQIISFFILGILSKPAVKKDDYTPQHSEINSRISIGEGLTRAVMEAIYSCVSMCALVVLFSAICEVLTTLGSQYPWIKILAALTEITNGTKIFAETGSVILIAAACGFGGLCVHFQIFSMLKGIAINKPLFFSFRALQGILCAGTTYILLKLFPRYEAVFSTTNNIHMQTYSGIVTCISLIACCVIFLISIRKTNRYKY